MHPQQVQEQCSYLVEPEMQDTSQTPRIMSDIEASSDIEAPSGVKAPPGVKALLYEDGYDCDSDYDSEWETADTKEAKKYRTGREKLAKKRNYARTCGKTNPEPKRHGTLHKQIASIILSSVESKRTLAEIMDDGAKVFPYWKWINGNHEWQEASRKKLYDNVRHGLTTNTINDKNWPVIANADMGGVPKEKEGYVFFRVKDGEGKDGKWQVNPKIDTDAVLSDVADDSTQATGSPRSSENGSSGSSEPTLATASPESPRCGSSRPSKSTRATKSSRSPRKGSSRSTVATTSSQSAGTGSNTAGTNSFAPVPLPTAPGHTQSFGSSQSAGNGSNTTGANILPLPPPAPVAPAVPQYTQGHTSLQSSGNGSDSSSPEFLDVGIPLSIQREAGARGGASRCAYGVYNPYGYTYTISQR